MSVEYVSEFLAGDLHGATPKSNWWPVRRRIELAAEYAADPVLDLGAGTGWLSMHLERWGYDVTATDYDGLAIEHFRSNMVAIGSRLEIMREDIRRMSLPDGSFGSVFCFSVLEHIAEVDLALDELHRVMRPGGTVAVGVPNVLGTYSLLNDHDPRAMFRVRKRGDIRQDHENLHAPRWWHRKLSERFTVHRSIPLEVLSPVIARFAGYELAPRWTRADVKIAQRLPLVFASDVIFVARKRTERYRGPGVGSLQGSDDRRPAPVSVAPVARCTGPSAP